MKQEMILLALSLGVGMTFCFVYDFFRILRDVIKHCDVVTSGEDLLYWIFSGVGAFAFFLFFNNGIYRFYMFLAMIAGSILYRMTIGKVLVKPVGILLKKILEIATRILKKIKLWFKIKRGLKNGSKTRGDNIEKK